MYLERLKTALLSGPFGLFQILPFYMLLTPLPPVSRILPQCKLPHTLGHVSYLSLHFFILSGCNSEV